MARPFEEMVNFQPEKGAILANATPLGMHPNTDRIPVPEVYCLPFVQHIINISILFSFTNFFFLSSISLFRFFKATLGDYQLVFDSVYTPRKTRLLKEAEAAGAIIVSGVEMFLRQAIGQFNLFTGGQGNWCCIFFYFTIFRLKGLLI